MSGSQYGQFSFSYSATQGGGGSSNKRQRVDQQTIGTTGANTNDFFIDFVENAPTQTPDDGKVRLYAKTDKKLYIRNDIGTEIEVGSGGLQVVADIPARDALNATAESGDVVFVVADSKQYVWSGAAWVELINGGNIISSVNGKTGTVVLSTTDVAEGTNLYHTQARFNTAFNAKDTGALPEGTNLYYTAARFDDALSSKSTDDVSEGATNKYYTDGRFAASLAAKTTTDIAEGTNLYWTGTRNKTLINDAVIGTDSTYSSTKINSIIPPGGGQNNTLVSDGGTSLVNAKDLDVLHIKGLTSANTKLTITSNTNDLELKVDETKIDHDNILNNAGNPHWTSTADNKLHGTNAGVAITTGTGNLCIGNDSLKAVTSASNNVSIGRSAGENVTDSGNPANGHSNTFVGAEACKGTVASTTHDSVAIGYKAMHIARSGSNYNVAVGSNAGVRIFSSNGHTMVGWQAGKTTYNGNNNTCIGRDTDTAAANTNCTAIGYQAACTDSNTIVLGNASITNVSTAGSLSLGVSPTNYTLPNTRAGSVGQVLTAGAGDAVTWVTPAGGGGGGNVSNAGSGTDNAIARFESNGTTIQNSGVTIDDSNNVVTAGSVQGASFREGSNTGLLVKNGLGNSTNLVVGATAGNALTAGAGGNILFGWGAGVAMSSGFSNTCVGRDACAAMTTGNGNVTIGASSHSFATTSSNNVTIGTQSGGSMTTGSNNVLVGAVTGYALTTGARNTCIGHNTDVDSATGIFRISIGSGAISDVDNHCVIGAPLAVDAITCIKSGRHQTTALGEATRQFTDLHMSGDIIGHSGKWTKAQYTAALPELMVNTAINWDMGADNRQVFIVITTSGANITVTTTNQKAGGTYILVIKQNGTAAVNITSWGAHIKWPGTAATLTQTVNAVDVFTFVCIEDGGAMLGVSSKNYTL